MAHWSEQSIPLVAKTFNIGSVDKLLELPESEPTVWVFLLPPSGIALGAGATSDWFDSISQFSSRLSENSVVAIWTSPELAAEKLPRLTTHLRFQLWVAVKHRETEHEIQGHLRHQHGALLILSRYSTSMRHTKTRIAYTYCPACDKTTKDYGGKKHTYHEYGTLMSDVWRDLDIQLGQTPTPVVDRLADVFGMAPYRYLNVVNISCHAESPPDIPKCEAGAEERCGRNAISSQLIQGDSLEILRAMQSDCIDFCFADPPYNLDKKYDIWDDALDVNQYLQWCSDWIQELARVLRPGRTCAVLNIPTLAARHFHQMKAAGLTFQNWIAWEGLSLPVRMIMPAHYGIVCFSKGPARPLSGFKDQLGLSNRPSLLALKENYCLRQGCIDVRGIGENTDREPISDLWWDVHRLKHNSRRVDHPCQLPPLLMSRLIEMFTDPDEIVLDPFDDAGTTSLCAEQLQRRFVGIELSVKYHKLAVSRHQVLRQGRNPFAKQEHVPAVKNSRVKRIGGAKYEVPKKTLQLEVKRIARELQRLPTRDDLEKLSEYPLWMFDEFFISWGEVCAAARTTGMRETRSESPMHGSTQQQKLFE